MSSISVFSRCIFMSIGLMIALMSIQPLRADCDRYVPPPPPPLSSMVCNAIVFVTLDGNNADHSQGGLDYQFTNSNGYKPFNRGVWGTCQGSSWNDIALGVQGKHVLLEIQAHPPTHFAVQPYDPNTDRAKARILLGPNLQFEDGSREIDVDIPRAPKTFKKYLNVIPTDCQVALDAWKRWKQLPVTSPTPPPPMPASPSAPHPCPQLTVIRSDVREINRIASRLELDEVYYQAAAADMLQFGYSSGFAKLAFSGDEASITRTFATPAAIASSRPSIVVNVRQKADFRQQMATAMYAYSQGQPYHPPETGDKGITDSVAGYLCSADPSKIDVPGWDALYHAGYIAAPLYRNVRAKMQSNAIMGPIVMAATMDLAPLAVGVLRIPALAGRVAVSAEDVGVLKTLAKSDLGFESPPTFSTIKERLLGKELNALKFKNFHPPFKEDAPAYRASTNETMKLVRVFGFREEGGTHVSGKVGRWLFRRELLVDESGDLLPAAVIKDRLALENMPTHICDVTVPADTEYWVGTVAPREDLNAKGLMEQFYVEAKEMLRFGEDIPLTR